jgi:class I fructose-bisphosphate aldolase
MYNTGRLGGTGYLSILPVDQGIEHSAGASFAPNPIYFDPRTSSSSAIEGGCNAVASTFGVLGIGGPQVRPQDPVHRQDQPQRADVVPEHVRPDPLRQVNRPSTWARRVGATIYFGSTESRRQIVEIAEAFAEAHELGMFTVLWCYLRNNAFKTAARTTTWRPTSRARPTTSA